MAFFAVMINFPFIIFLSEIINISMQKNLKERNHQAENHPDINHLDIRGCGKAATDADEKGGQNQHGGHIHCDSSLKEERFEVISIVADDDQEMGM